MTRALVVEFTKMHGAGNDFIVIDNRFYHFTPDEQGRIARRWCRRTEGIGADGLLAFEAADDDAHDYRMRYTNADGSAATMCANGARCMAVFASMSGIEADVQTFETDAGLYRAQIVGKERVRLYVPPPRDLRREVALEGRGLTSPPSYIWTGTEHLVCFVEDVAVVDVDTLGRALREDAALAPEGANIDFVETNGDLLRVRTYEKGVEAETRACGTGAVAAALLARLSGRVSGDKLRVDMPGGTLTVGATLEGERFRDVYLEGPAVKVFRGTFEF